MERDKKLGTRDVLNDEEYAKRAGQKRAISQGR